MRFFISPIFLLVLLSPVSAEFFFPNVTGIPPSRIQNATRAAWDAFKNLSGCHAGDTVNGLSKLKRYFQRFGYLDETLISGNFTDDFDDVLESAIKMYQKNFKLNETGELDESTVRHITLPRCGNPDVVNGSTAMHGGRKYETTPYAGIHAVKHYAFFPGTPRWNKRELTYAFLPQNQLSEEVKSVFTRAFDRWARVTQLKFTRSESYSNADIRIGFFSGDHGDGEPFDGELGTLAHAFSPRSGRFHLDVDENWVVSGDVRRTLTTTSAVDLESVAVHEIGHLLGLGHSSVEEAIMYPTITTGSRKVELASDDVEGIQFLYGSNPNFNGSTETMSGQERETGDFGGARSLGESRWVSGSLVAVGLVGWLLQ